MTALSCVLVFLALLAWLLRRFEDFPGPLEVLKGFGSLAASPQKLKELGVRLETLNIKVSPELFTAFRLAGALVLTAAGGVAIWKSPFAGVALLFLAFLAYKFPEWQLARLEKARKEEIGREFPLMVDMVRIYARAADLYQALKIVPYALKGELAKQMHILSAELEIAPMAEALENFAHRCGLRQVQDFVGVVLQGIRSGMDVDEILQRYSSMAYERRVTEIKRKIKAQPLILSVLPGLLMFSLIILWVLPMYSNIIQKLKAF
ncbi:type II secretion system F family protein [Desulfofundulus salinus]|uniref:Type II secretion system protein GspF domain-containing protein n=1 Tax=Desulfofundulus salinus TaxID=2419843 RepID=A0A494WR95_9FIRM|nr:type II secretion system F family protein [Desulfofundulus salinum]RKO65718.1 hypothetical protein D7024_01190 [Desulfofundulus salinum]